MARMTKKRRAFQLFDEGKDRHDPEVKALGLSTRVRSRYFREWKRLQEPEAPAEVSVVSVSGRTVPVRHIAMGAKFEYDGKLYRKVNAIGNTVIGLQLITEGNLMFQASHYRLVMDAQTEVIPK